MPTMWQRDQQRVRVLRKLRLEISVSIKEKLFIIWPATFFIPRSKSVFYHSDYQIQNLSAEAEPIKLVLYDIIYRLEEFSPAEGFSKNSNFRTCRHLSDIFLGIFKRGYEENVCVRGYLFNSFK